MEATCKICGKAYTMGENGMIDGCDTCRGIERDKDGCAWEKGEKFQYRQRVGTDTIYRISRKVAFEKGDK